MKRKARGHKRKGIEEVMIQDWKHLGEIMSVEGKEQGNSGYRRSENSIEGQNPPVKKIKINKNKNRHPFFILHKTA